MQEESQVNLLEVFLNYEKYFLHVEEVNWVFGYRKAEKCSKNSVHHRHSEFEKANLLNRVWKIANFLEDLTQNSTFS